MRGTAQDSHPRGLKVRRALVCLNCTFLSRVKALTKLGSQTAAWSACWSPAAPAVVSGGGGRLTTGSRPLPPGIRSRKSRSPDLTGQQARVCAQLSGCLAPAGLGPHSFHSVCTHVALGALTAAGRPSSFQPLITWQAVPVLAGFAGQNDRGRRTRSNWTGFQSSQSCSRIWKGLLASVPVGHGRAPATPGEPRPSASWWAPCPAGGRFLVLRDPGLRVEAPVPLGQQLIVSREIW